MYFKSVIDCIQEEVNRICEDKYKDDDCKPIFLVSLITEKGGDRLILTITHSYQSFSEILFPRHDALYGYETIEFMMKMMYNRTM